VLHGPPWPRRARWRSVDKVEPLLLLRADRRCPFCTARVGASLRVCPRCARPLDAGRNNWLTAERRRHYWLGTAYALGLLLLLAWLFAWFDLG
jgi:predicted amidophosphoribosyltransferase